ncbi:selenium cofactor biosynthesis protein YqeC [Pseudomonadota bacterium]
MEINILDVFEAHKGIIAVAGAGGKKSTIYRLVTAHSGRIAVTSTVHTPRFRRRLNLTEVVCEEDNLLSRVAEAAKSSARIAYAHPSEKAARLRGVSPDAVPAVHDLIGCDATFVKADGARLRLLKAPDHNQPVLPSGTTVLVSILSIHAIGKPLSDDVAHHAPEVARAMNINVGDKVTAEHLARLLSTDYGVLEGADHVELIPVLNMVENKEDRQLGRMVAEQALASSNRFNRVVLASMIQDNPVIEVIGY